MRIAEGGSDNEGDDDSEEDEDDDDESNSKADSHSHASEAIVMDIKTGDPSSYLSFLSPPHEPFVSVKKKLCHPL